ncbi:MAG TPA: serine/threonine-protein kinase [Polyangiaceae bacterium]|nr:serine/threonine-protein kinase [Polyangiaceae bacterium]
MTKSARQNGPEAAGSAPGGAPSEPTSADAWSSGLRSYATSPAPTATLEPEADAGRDELSSAYTQAEPPRSSLGKFHFLERIGRGGMGEVYLALLSGPTGFSKLVVVKLLREDFAAYEAIRAMFLDEGRLAARLNHPNVVQTNEVGVEEGKHYLVMEYLEGQPLDRLIKRVREAGFSVPPGLWVRVALDSLSGLDYAHELCDYDGTPLNVVHRDLSPHNIFLTYEGVVKLLDFGIAKAATQSAQTQTGTVKGKPSYMAPEQLMGLPVDRRADLFVFGIVLWEMFTGTRLFSGTLNECLKRVTGGPLPPVSSVVPNFDPGLDAVVSRALERDPGARFQTAREMREALAAAALRSYPVPPQEAVGELMRSLFRERREQRRLAVQRYVSERVRNPASPRGLAGLPGTGPQDLNLLASATGLPTPLTGVAWAQTGSAQHAQGRPRGATPADGVHPLDMHGGSSGLTLRPGLPGHLSGGYPAQPGGYVGQTGGYAAQSGGFPTQPTGPFGVQQTGPFVAQSGRYIAVEPTAAPAPAPPAGGRAMFWVSVLLGTATLAAAGSLVLVLTLSQKGSGSRSESTSVEVSGVNADETASPPSPSAPAASAEPAGDPSAAPASGSAAALSPPAAAPSGRAPAAPATGRSSPVTTKHDPKRPPPPPPRGRGHEPQGGPPVAVATPAPAPPTAAPRASQEGAKRPPGRTFRTELD